VMAETALPADAIDYINDPRAGLSEMEKEALDSFLKNGRRVRGQTPDALRRAGLKIVTGVLQDRIRQELQPPDYWNDFRVITNEPRHLIRSIPPSVTDVIFGERLGALAVDNAMAGYTDFMVSQWLTEFVLVPLPLVVLGRKRVPTDGIFWKSVLSKTGQPTQPTKSE
jgi:6-phosphofructokinase